MRLASLAILAMHCDQCRTGDSCLRYDCCCYSNGWRSLLLNFVVNASVSWTILLHRLLTFRYHSICYYCYYYLYCYCQTMPTHYCYLNDVPTMWWTTMCPMLMNDSMILSYSRLMIAAVSTVDELWLDDFWTKPVKWADTLEEKETEKWMVNLFFVHLLVVHKVCATVRVYGRRSHMDSHCYSKSLIPFEEALQRDLRGRTEKAR